ncbi:MAG: hypothetical protein M1834_007712 [Cirrosporium novae-zelandiae]|nr:MAG: hypothetical protein M1834_007712 [Cirrosporium novae-zelandiae]
MPRGNAPQTKVFFKGSSEDFVVFVDHPDELKKWKSDKSIPLAQVMSGFKIFVTHKQGSQGVLDGASNAILDNEFGTHNEDEVITKILEGGLVQETESAERQGSKNDSKGAMVAH